MSTRAIEVLFALLSACRREQADSAWRLRRALRRRGLSATDAGGRLDFWLRLARAADLLDDGVPPRPTLLVPEWLQRLPGAQLSDLLRAWTRMPVSLALRRRRLRLLDRLHAQAAGAKVHLEPAYQRELLGLKSLGVYADDDLTPLGQKLLNRQLDQIAAPLPVPWKLAGSLLVVPPPCDWALLWELEAYVSPKAAGCYDIAQAAGNDTHRNDELIRILERGLGVPLPEQLRARLFSPPHARVLSGVLLEFDEPQILVQYRQSSPSLRRTLDKAGRMISPRHLLLETDKAADVIRRLGLSPAIPAITDKELTSLLSGAGVNHFLQSGGAATVAASNNGLSCGDRAYLLSLVLAAGRLGLPLCQPYGLVKRLESGLPASLREAAIQVLERLEIVPPAECLPTPDGDELSPLPLPELLERLQRAIAAEETLAVLYQLPGRPEPERRRITPLLLEKRGLRHYLVAYCHVRRAQRTFRLDRLTFETI